MEENEEKVTHIYMKTAGPLSFEQEIPETFTGKVRFHLPRVPVEVVEFSDVPDSGLVKWVRPVLITMDFDDIVYKSGPVIQMLKVNENMLMELFTKIAAEATSLDPVEFKTARSIFEIGD